ncbi:MAG: thermonuclease family protein [Patescibacteria group bacterium]|jgi:endonuclease YncB( thermonuclease family)
MKKIIFIISLFVLFFGFYFVDAKKHKVVQVLDGNTIKVNIHGKIKSVKLIGIDAPKIKSFGKSDECFGKEALSYLKSKIENKRVKILKDSDGRKIDNKGFLLRYVYLGEKNISAKILKDGYVYVYTGYHFSKVKRFKKLEKYARNNERGLWNISTCDGQREIPVKEPVKVISHIYYTSSYYTARYYYCDTDDAWKGLSPTYLRSFNSVEELLRNFPGRILHQPC